MPYYDTNTDTSLPPPAIGGNEPTTAPYDPRFEYPYAASPTPPPISYSPYQGGIPSNPWATPTPVPGGPGGPPSATVQSTPTPTPYDNYAGPSDVLNQQPGGYGGIATPGLDPSMGGMPWGGGGDAGNHYVSNPNGGYDVYDNNWTWVGNVPAGGNPQGLANIPGVTYNANDTGPSDLPGNGPLYYNPISKSWLSKAASAVGGIPGSIGNAARGVSAGIRNAIETPGFTSPAYLRSIGYEPGQATGSLFPGGVTGATPGSGGIGGFGVGGQGGSFYGGMPGDPGGRGVYRGALPGTPGIFGYRQEGANIGDYYGRMSLERLRHGGDASLGFIGTGYKPGGILPISQWGGTGYGAPVTEASTQMPGAAPGHGGTGPGGIA